VAGWLRRGLEPDPEARFQDAELMRKAWVDVVRSVAAHKEPLWKQWLAELGGERSDLE
jgi:hypothetical protein